MLDKKIKISVIIPVYNEEKYLEECISSICNQTYKNLEIILVDDGSSLPCYKACDSYIEKDKRIKVFHKENGGSLSARRKGIEEATGDYVAFVDSDDWIELDLYEKMIEVANKTYPDIIGSSNYYRNYTNGDSINTYNNTRIGFWKNDEFGKEVFPYFIKTTEFFDTEFPISMWAYLFKTNFARTIMRKIEDKIKTSEDYVFLILSFLNAQSFVAISYRGYHYRKNSNSKTHNLKNVKELLIPVYESVNFAIIDSDYSSSVKETLKNKNRLHLYHAFMIKDYRELIQKTDEYLFPYPEVKRGSRIFIYGAGKLGEQLYNTININSDYTVVGVTDKNWQSYRQQGIDVLAPEEILCREYDYIIIAVTYANIKNQIKTTLIELGVPERKIAEIDMSVLDESHLPF